MSHNQHSRNQLKNPHKAGSLVGRSKANNFEPTFTSLLHTLNKSWDNAIYEKETAPIVAAIDVYEGSNQVKGKMYTY